MSGGPFAAPSCAAAILEGTQVGAVTLGWQVSGGTTAEASSSLCPPTFIVEKIEGEPASLPSELTFTLALDDQLYDVTMKIVPSCDSSGTGSGVNLRCDLN